MERFTTLTAVAAPLLMQNVDTDVIIRIERLIESRRVDLSKYCLESVRYRPDGSPAPDFILNQPPYDKAKILLAGANFGCGSSREPAVWALMDIGLRCVIAPSFGDIFYNNAFQNSLLPVILPMAEIHAIADDVKADPAGRLVTVDLVDQCVRLPGGQVISFPIDARRREGLLEGLDDIGLSLRRESDIAAFQARDKRQRAWAYTPNSQGAAP